MTKVYLNRGTLYYPGYDKEGYFDEHIQTLSSPSIQKSLSQVHWSAKKYAQLLHAGRPRPASDVDKIFSQLPGFQNVNKMMRQTAIEIVESYKAHRHCFMDHAVKVFLNTEPTNDPNRTTDPDTVFTHADDFGDLESLFFALQKIPLERCHKLFSLPGIEKLYEFTFLTLGCFDEEFFELSCCDEQKIELFFTQPNMLETILSCGLAHISPMKPEFYKMAEVTRWKIVVYEEMFDDQLSNLIIERIAQDRGDTLLDLLGKCPDEIDIETARKVYDIIKKGYEQQDNAHRLSSAQWKQLDFFPAPRPQPHPFLKELEKSIAAKEAQIELPKHLTY